MSHVSHQTMTRVHIYVHFLIVSLSSTDWSGFHSRLLSVVQ